MSHIFNIPIIDLIVDPRETKSDQAHEIGEAVLHIVREAEAKYQQTKPGKKTDKQTTPGHHPIGN